MTDPIADMLTRIRNAIMVRHDSVQVPASKVKLAIAKILKEEGFVTDYEVVKGKTSPHDQGSTAVFREQQAGNLGHETHK